MDPKRLLDYMRRRLSELGFEYMVEDVNDDHVRLVGVSRRGTVEVLVNNEVRLEGLNDAAALFFRYLGTEGLRRISLILVERDGRVVRVKDLPRFDGLSGKFVVFFMVGLALTLMTLAPLRVMEMSIPTYLVVLLMLPVGVPVAYSLMIPMRLRNGDVSHSRILKFTIEYDDDIDESLIKRVADNLGRLSIRGISNETRRNILSLVNSHEIKPRAIREEYIDMSRIVSGGVRVYLVDSHLCNASSISIINIKAIVITTKLLSALNFNELRAVIAHEMGHIIHGDSMKVLSLVSLNQLINVILLLYTAVPIPLVVLAYPLENALLLYVMRLSEYSADKYAVSLAGREALINALLRVTWRDAYMEFLGRARRLGVHPPVLRRLERIIAETQ